METLSSLLLSAVHPRGVRFALQALVLGGAALPLRTHSARHRRVYRRPFEAGQPRRELLAGVFVVASGTVTVAVREAGEPVRFGEVTRVSSLVTFAVLFIVNEAGFYASHRALPLPQVLLPACPAPHRAHDAPPEHRLLQPRRARPHPGLRPRCWRGMGRTAL